MKFKRNPVMERHVTAVSRRVERLLTEANIRPEPFRDDVRVLFEDARLLRRQRSVTLFLWDLREIDFDRFHAGKVLYSGEARGLKKTKTKNRNAWYDNQYIATSFENLLPAVNAMGWDRFLLRFEGNSVKAIRR